MRWGEVGCSLMWDSSSGLRKLVQIGWGADRQSDKIMQILREFTTRHS